MAPTHHARGVGEVCAVEIQGEGGEHCLDRTPQEHGAGLAHDDKHSEMR
jgi:hypothetical protein